MLQRIQKLQLLRDTKQNLNPDSRKHRPMLRVYSHQSGDDTFTCRTLLTTTEMQICGDADLDRSKLTKFLYSGRHRLLTVGPHAITLPVTVLQHHITHACHNIIS